MCEYGFINESCDIFVGHKSDGDYHKEMTADYFENWLIRSIPIYKELAGERKVLFVMDNAAYHTRKSFKIPRKSNSRKQEMIDFLEDQGILVPPGCTKEDLDKMIAGKFI